MYRAGYQSLESKTWSSTAVIALVATASLALGVAAGAAFADNAQTLYAPVSTAVRPAVLQAPLTQMAAGSDLADASVEVPVAQEYAEVETVYEIPQQQGVSAWTTGLAAAAATAVGTLVYKFKSQKIPQVAPLDVYTKAVIPGATLMAAQPAMAMQTNSQAPIATALFIALPTFFLIILYVKTVANPDAASGGYSQDYYDRSKSAGNKKANEAARLKGEGVAFYAEKSGRK